MTDLTDSTEALATLQTRVIDASEGHAEGAERTDDPTMARVFQELHGMHKTHASTLGAALVTRGIEPDADGSFLQHVHKAIIDVRSAFGALGESAMPGVRDGEERILDLYDDTLNLAHGDAELAALLTTQRGEVAEAIDRMRALEGADG
ncbi:PA2169 family four-helix-bundle protein [Thiocapsa sp.]|uniref:PA2169 family four-helix-bundle protein n=1 Tax=Thiocapsa sp. TaxID=2024551 RepID=UPI0035947F09